MNLAVAFIALLALVAAICVVIGVKMLAGTAWALIATGTILFAAAIFLRAGLKPHG